MISPALTERFLNIVERDNLFQVIETEEGFFDTMRKAINEENKFAVSLIENETIKNDLMKKTYLKITAEKILSN